MQCLCGMAIPMTGGVYYAWGFHRCPTCGRIYVFAENGWGYTGQKEEFAPEAKEKSAIPIIPVLFDTVVHLPAIINGRYNMPIEVGAKDFLNLKEGDKLVVGIFEVNGKKVSQNMEV